MSATGIINKVWNYARILRDDGVGYGDNVEQITYLVFLKISNTPQIFGKIPPNFFHNTPTITYTQLAALVGFLILFAAYFGFRYVSRFRGKPWEAQRWR